MSTQFTPEFIKQLQERLAVDDFPWHLAIEHLSAALSEIERLQDELMAVCAQNAKLEARVTVAEIEATLDNKDMRRFQGKFILADQVLRDIADNGNHYNADWSRRKAVWAVAEIKKYDNPNPPISTDKVE
jgi:hypothetical protein